MPFDFSLLTIKDLADIFLVAYLLYKTYKLMKASGSINAFIGILLFIVVWIIVSQVLQMKLLGSIFDKLVSVGVIALIVLFQDEIRHFLFNIGSRPNAGGGILRFLQGKKKTDPTQEFVKTLVVACLNMGKKRVGALIVLERHFPLEYISKTGTLVDAVISQMLIENIFFKNSPLHDGAMIISNGRIHAAGCILPVSNSLDIPKQLGLRHRAALGISQETDAITIIVSEETGAVSIAWQGRFYLNLSPESLEEMILHDMTEKVS